MRHIALAVGLAVSLLGSVVPAAAQYYYDRGYYPPPPPPPPYYGPRYYDGPGYAPPAYRGGGWRPAYVDRHGQQTYYPGPRRTCPRGYTVQDGLCKPYRGY